MVKFGFNIVKSSPSTIFLKAILKTDEVTKLNSSSNTISLNNSVIHSSISTYLIPV